MGFMFWIAMVAQAHVQDPDRATDWTRDLDRDGIVDALDWDRDGDGVGNIVDVAPDDAQIKDGDRDGDGIPDFADWNEQFPVRSAEMCERQAKIFAQTGVIFIMPMGESFVSEFLDNALAMLLVARPTQEHLRFVMLEPQGPSEASAQNLGFYDPNQKLIRLRTIPVPYRSWFVGTHYVWAHELAHVLQKAQPNVYADFLRQSGWSVEESLLGPSWRYATAASELPETFLQSEFHLEPERVQATLRGNEFVSELAKLGGEEMFAESWAATWLHHTRLFERYQKAEFVQEWKLNSKFLETPLAQSLDVYFISGSRW